MRLFVLIGALFLATLVAAPISHGENSLAEEDAILNRTYKQSLLRFPQDQQEPLRRAQRAWIPFSNKTEAVFEALRDEYRIGQKTVDAANCLELACRSKHLSIYFCEPTIPATGPEEYRDKDQQLGDVYSKCMKVVSPRVQNLLRESERAWITFRDADAAVFSNQRIQHAALCHLTEERRIVLGLIAKFAAFPSNAPPQQSQPQERAIQETQIQAPTISPEDAAAAKKFQEDAKALLNQMLSQKNDAFFKKTESIMRAPEFTPEFRSRITKLSSDYKALSQNTPLRVLIPLRDESSAILLFEGWTQFLQELKDGSVFDAGKILRSALDRKTPDMPPAYRPLWDAAGSWEDAYLNDERKYNGHLQKAKEFTAKLQSADAIKEYQAAYEIIPNASIPKEIQKVREQSLGL